LKDPSRYFSQIREGRILATHTSSVQQLHHFSGKLFPDSNTLSGPIVARFEANLCSPRNNIADSWAKVVIWPNKRRMPNLLFNSRLHLAT